MKQRNWKKKKTTIKQKQHSYWMPCRCCCNCLHIIILQYSLSFRWLFNAHLFISLFSYSQFSGCCSLFSVQGLRYSHQIKKKKRKWRTYSIDEILWDNCLVGGAHCGFSSSFHATKKTTYFNFNFSIPMNKLQWHRSLHYHYYYYNIAFEIRHFILC